MKKRGKYKNKGRPYKDKYYIALIDSEGYVFDVIANLAEAAERYPERSYNNWAGTIGRIHKGTRQTLYIRGELYAVELMPAEAFDEET